MELPAGNVVKAINLILVVQEHNLAYGGLMSKVTEF